MPILTVNSHTNVAHQKRVCGFHINVVTITILTLSGRYKIYMKIRCYFYFQHSFFSILVFFLETP